MADRLLELLQQSERERVAQRAAEKQPVPVLENGNPNVRMRKALETVIPTQHNFSPPDIPKEDQTVAKRGWQSGPDGDRLKKLLDDALQSGQPKPTPQPPVPGHTTGGRTF